MFGIGVQELIIVLVVGLLAIGVPVAMLLVLVLRLWGKQD